MLELARVASTTEELRTVAWYFALRRRPETGIGFARRALAAEPGCIACRSTLALLLYQMDRIDEAIEAQEAAVNMSAAHGVPEEWIRLLDHYRAHRRGR